MIELLLVTGPETNARDERDNTPQMLVAVTGPAELISSLVDAGADISGASAVLKTPLHYTARYGDCESVWFMIVVGADPKARYPRAAILCKRASAIEPFELCDRVRHAAESGQSGLYVDIAANKKRPAISDGPLAFVVTAAYCGMSPTMPST